MPEGFLPVYSCDTKKQAELLIAAACPMNYTGEYYAPELAEEQTLENLWAFGKRLAKIDEFTKRR